VFKFELICLPSLEHELQTLNIPVSILIVIISIILFPHISQFIFIICITRKSILLKYVVIIILEFSN
jgi:hypothetical protein